MGMLEIVGWILMILLISALILANMLLSEIAKFVVYINDSEPYFDSFWFAVFVYFLGFLASVVLSYIAYILIQKICENML